MVEPETLDVKVALRREPVRMPLHFGLDRQAEVSDLGGIEPTGGAESEGDRQLAI